MGDRRRTDTDPAHDLLTTVALVVLLAALWIAPDVLIGVLR